MLLQPDKSELILDAIKEFDAHEARSHLTLMKNSEVKNKHTNKDVNLKTILSIWYFHLNRLPYGRLIKQ